MNGNEQTQAVEREAAVPGGEAVGYVFELAGAKFLDTGGWTNWGPPQFSFTKPSVPEGSIRNLRPLYASPAHRPPQPGVVTEELRDGAAKAKQIVDLWFEPWSAARDAKWKEATGNREFSPDIALALVCDLLAAPSPGATASPADGDVIEALRPFAEISPFVQTTNKRDGERVHEQRMPNGKYFVLTRADFRRAAKAYAAALSRLEASQPASSGSEWAIPGIARNEPERFPFDAPDEFATPSPAVETAPDAGRMDRAWAEWCEKHPNRTSSAEEMAFEAGWGFARTARAGERT
jgi:hypothetical protein